ncbi:MAG: UbiD family decarboxylase [Nitrososphaerota archaeon]|nr:UbiD family decarboxylase [Nitrososphaerota archaeon]MDG6922656.1 UbiD family decarboxylase [Nitrososphaerota archaeon]
MNIPFDGLSDFIDALERDSELKRITAAVDLELEIEEILRRGMYERKFPLLFENIKGYSLLVAGNLFGSKKNENYSGNMQV